MPSDVLQWPDWYGEPKELGDLFRLTKNRPEARASVWTHQLGWEVRLLGGRQLEAVRSQVCRSQDEILATDEDWRASMTAQGWTPSPSAAPLRK